jgi:hypothetical protein
MKFSNTTKLQIIWMISIAILLYVSIVLWTLYYDYEHFEETCKNLGGIYTQTQEEKLCYQLEKHDVTT